MSEVENNPQAKPRRKKSLNKHNSCSNGEESPDSRVQAPGLEGLEGEAPGYLKPPRRDHAYTFDLECGNGRPGIGVALGVKDMGMFSKEVKGRDEVYSRKENGQFFYVSSLEDSSTRDCGLRVGDEILVINAYKLDTVSSVFAVETILEQSWRSGRVRISVARPRLSTSMQNLSELITPLEVPEESDVNHNISPPPSPSEQLEYNQESNMMNDEFSQFMSSTYEIELQKEEGGKPLGIGIVGGVDAPMGAIGIFVKSIYPGGLAGEDGRICVGDELLAVNGEILHGLKHSEAVQILKSLEPGAISIIIRRDDQQIIPPSPTHKTVDQEVRSPLSSMSGEISAPPRRKKSNPSTPTIHSSTSPLLLEKQNSLSGINEENHHNSGTDQRMDVAAPSHFNGDSTTRTSDMLNKINTSSIMNGNLESFEAKNHPNGSVLHGDKKAGLSNGKNTGNGNRSDIAISQSEENDKDYSKFILPSPPEFKSATTPVSNFPHGDEEKLNLSGSNEFLNEPPEGFEPPVDFEPPEGFEPPGDFRGFEPPPVCNESFDDDICPPEEFVENLLSTTFAGISEKKNEMEKVDKKAIESEIVHAESNELEINSADVNGINVDFNAEEKQNFDYPPDNFDIPPEPEISSYEIEESDDELPPPPPPSSLPPPLPTSEIPDFQILSDADKVENKIFTHMELNSSNSLNNKVEEKQEEHFTGKDFDDRNLPSAQNEFQPLNEEDLIPPPIPSFNNLPDKTSLSLSESSNPIFDEEIEAASDNKMMRAEIKSEKPVINRMKPTTQPKPHVSYKPKKKIEENEVTVTKTIVEKDAEKERTTDLNKSSNTSSKDLTDVENENVVSMDASTSNEVFAETTNESSTSISSEKDVPTVTHHSETDLKNTDGISGKNIQELNKKDCEAENANKQQSATFNNTDESSSSAQNIQNVSKVTDNKPVLENSSTSSTVQTTSAEAGTITRTPSEGKEFSSYLSLMQRSAFRSPFQSQNNTVKSFKVPNIPSTKTPVESAHKKVQSENKLVEETKSNDKEEINKVISPNAETIVESQPNLKEKDSEADLHPPLPKFNEHLADQNSESNFPPPPIPSSPPPSLPFSPPPDFQSPPVCADPPTPFASSSIFSSPFQSTVSKLPSVQPITAELKTYEPVQKEIERDENTTEEEREEKKTEENKSFPQRYVEPSLISKHTSPTDDIQESKINNSNTQHIIENNTDSKNSDVLYALNSNGTISLSSQANTDLKSIQQPRQLSEKDSKNISRNADDVNIGVSLEDKIPNGETNTVLTNNYSIPSKPPSKSSESVTEESNDAFSKSKRTMSKDEMISNVLKDYYTMEDPAPAPVVEEKKKPAKPLIAQALLPKSKRNQPITATLLSSSNSAQNTVPSTGKDSLVDHSSTTNTPTVSTSEFPAEDLRKHSIESGLKSENDRKSFTRLSNARYSDVFEPDSFTVSKNQSISSDSKSYLLSKYLEEQADQSNQSDIVSSKDSVCSASDHSDRMSEVESMDYKANVANSAAFYEALDKKRTSNFKSTSASVRTASSNHDMKDEADGDKIQSEKQPAAPNKVVNNDEVAKQVNQKEQSSVVNTEICSPKDEPASEENEAENVISVSAGRHLFEGKTNKVPSAPNKVQVNNTSEDVTSDSASLISSSSSDNKAAPSLPNNNEPIAESNQKSEASEQIVRKPSITSSTIQQRAMKFPQSFGIRGFSDADITKVKEITEMKSMETFPSVIKVKEAEQKSEVDKIINEEIDRKPIETASSEIKEKEVNQDSELDKSIKQENGAEVNVKEEEQEKINIKDSRAFFKSLSNKSDKNLPNKAAQQVSTVEQKPVVNVNTEHIAEHKADTKCTENSKNINISINANNNYTKNSTSALVNNKPKANDSVDKPISNGNVKNIADKSVADKSIVDKSIADRSIVDKSIADKSIVDKGIADKSIVNKSETKRNFITSTKSVDESQNKSLSAARDTTAINSSNGEATPVNNNLNTNTSISKDLKSPVTNKTEVFLRNNESNLNNRVFTNMGNGCVPAPAGPEASRPLQRNQRSCSLQPTMGGVIKKPPPTAPKSDSTRSGNQENTKYSPSASQVNKTENVEEKEEESISMEAIFDKFKKISAPTKGDNDSAKKSEDDTTQSGRGRNFSIPAQKTSILPSPLLNKDKDSNLNRGRRSVQIFNTAEKD